MSVHIKFDTGCLSREEANGIAAFITAVQPTLETAEALRARADTPFSGKIVPLYAAETALPTAAQEAKTETVPVEAKAEPAKRGRKPKEEQVKAETADAAQVAALGEAKPNISTTPEDRVDPAEAAQDAADEQAEVEANRDAEKPLTTDDVKAAMMLYVNKFTMVAAQEDGPKIYAEALGVPPNGEAGWRLSLVGGLSQDKIAKARDAWLSAANGEKRWGQ